MTGKQLFDLVNSLSQGECAAFTRFVGLKKGTKPGYYVLFETLKSEKEFDEEKVRVKANLVRKQKYYKAKRLLVDKILDSLVFSSKDYSYPKSYFLEALKRKAESSAQNKFDHLATRAYESNDFNYLFYLYNLITELKISTRLKLTIPSKLPSQDNVRTAILQNGRLKVLLGQLKDEAKSFSPKNSFRLSCIKTELSGFQDLSGYSGYLLRRTRAIFLLISSGPEAAVPTFENLITYLETERFPLREGYYLRELSNFILINCDLNRLEQAQNDIMKLSKLTFSNRGFENQRLKLLCKARINISTARINEENADDGYHSLISQPHLFREEEMGVLLLTYAIIKFIYGKNSECLQALHKLRSLPSFLWESLKYTVNILRFLVNYESQNVGILESILLSLTRQSKKTDLKYPSEVAKIIRRILNDPQNAISEITDEDLSRIDQLSYNPNERLIADIFNFQAWIRAKKRGISLYEAYYQDNSDWNQKAIISS